MTENYSDNHLRPEAQAGFTMVEIALVLIIVGLLMGGALKLQELVANARIDATISQITLIDSSIIAFRDVFGNLPGDLISPATKLPNCMGACSFAGNANDLIPEDPGAVITVDTEATASFLQLAAAGFITGVRSTPADVAINTGDEVLEAEIPGVTFRLGYADGLPVNGSSAVLGGADNTWRPGHYLSLSSAPTVAVGAQGPGVEGLLPSQAIKIDNKLDDGFPRTGLIRGGGNNACVAGGQNLYDASVLQKECALFIRVQN